MLKADTGRCMPLSTGAAERFLIDFDIKILRSVEAASRRTTEAPRISKRPYALGIGHSTAPIAAECQSFLDNVVAQFADI
jgi:hypothetical protein